MWQVKKTLFFLFFFPNPTLTLMRGLIRRPSPLASFSGGELDGMRLVI
jgi:hypothetical protein